MDKKQQRHDKDTLCSLAHSTDQVARQRALKTVKRWLRVRENATLLDYMKIWKVLWMSYWQSDKRPVQIEVAVNLSMLIREVPEALQLDWIGAYFLTMQANWANLDRIRMDKFMFFIRIYVAELLHWLKEKNWEEEKIDSLIGVLTAIGPLRGHVPTSPVSLEMLSSLPKSAIPGEHASVGLTVHFLKVLLDELKVSLEAEIDESLRSTLLLSLAGPLLTVMQFSSFENVVQAADRLIRAMVDLGLAPLDIYEHALDLGKEKGTGPTNRAALYQLLSFLEKKNGSTIVVGSSGPEETSFCEWSFEGEEAEAEAEEEAEEAEGGEVEEESEMIGKMETQLSEAENEEEEVEVEEVRTLTMKEKKKLLRAKRKEMKNNITEEDVLSFGAVEHGGDTALISAHHETELEKEEEREAEVEEKEVEEKEIREEKEEGGNKRKREKKKAEFIEKKRATSVANGEGKAQADTVLHKKTEGAVKLGKGKTSAVEEGKGKKEKEETADDKKPNHITFCKSILIRKFNKKDALNNKMEPSVNRPVPVKGILKPAKVLTAENAEDKMDEATAMQVAHVKNLMRKKAAIMEMQAKIMSLAVRRNSQVGAGGKKNKNKQRK